MEKVVFAEGLTLDHQMFEVTQNAVETYAPEWAHRLTWESFTSRASWRLIPDPQHPDLPFFKAEYVLLNEPPWTRTLKINVWKAADLRRDGRPIPHNHPWGSFTSHILMGGYQEHRYMLRADGGVEMRHVFHTSGGVNVMPMEVFHEVTDILAPDYTVTFMDGGPGIKDAWGYLDPDTGAYTPNQLSSIHPDFKRLMRERNPHLPS